MRRLVRDVSYAFLGLMLGGLVTLGWAQVPTTEDPHKIIRQQLMEYAAAVANLQVALRECQATQQTAPKAPEKK